MPLRLDDISTGYGGHVAISHATLSIERGEVVGLFGHNGAGKTTLLRVLAGQLPLWKGAREGRWDGASRAPLAALVPQDGLVFPTLSVEDNLRMGVWRQRLRSAELRRRVEHVLDLFPQLAGMLKREGGLLSGGEKRMVAIGRALLGEPELLLVDEPSIGLAPATLEIVMERLRRVHEEGTTIVLAEQNMPSALELVDRFYVVRQGETVREEQAGDFRDRDARELYALI
ncbi:MAG TPA: ATP-binding cassette domain-containing protein [Solirubrobacteraceae bacterium]